MKNISLSICIAAYNQIDLVRKNLDELVKYPEHNIEVVVSDDCSSDDLQSLVIGYYDERIKYTKTKENVGHDLNIIHAIRNSDADYVMILRSRDLISYTSIKEIITLIQKNKNSSYFLFSAVDENNKPKVILSNKRYKKGIEAIKASTKLLIHPSGQIYNRSLLNLEEIEEHINNSFQNKFGFEAHNLIRMQLAEKGDFSTFSTIGWIYTNTSKAKDIAQNSSDKGISVYAPFYEYKRYQCELEFVAKQISEEYKLILYRSVIKRFYRSILIDYCHINSDKNMQRHYNYVPIEYSKKKEWKGFKKHSIDFFCCDAQNQVKLKRYLYFIRFISIKFEIYSLMIRCFGNTKWFKYLHKIIKNI